MSKIKQDALEEKNNCTRCPGTAYVVDARLENRGMPSVAAWIRTQLIFLLEVYTLPVGYGLLAGTTRHIQATPERVFSPATLFLSKAEYNETFSHENFNLINIIYIQALRFYGQFIHVIRVIVNYKCLRLFSIVLKWCRDLRYYFH